MISLDATSPTTPTPATCRTRRARRRRAVRALVGVLATATSVAGFTAPSAHATTVAPKHALGAFAPTKRVAASTASAAAAAVKARPRSGVGAGAPAAVGAAPASVDLTPWSPPVGDQGAVGSCVTWAINYALLGWEANFYGHGGQPFAPMYAYSQIHAGNTPDGGGTSPISALNLAVNQGTASQIVYPHSNTDFTTQPSATERTEAAKHRISGYTQLWSGANQGAIASIVMQSLLAAQIPIAITLPVRPGFDNLGAAATAVDNDTSGSIRGYHEVLAVGYDANGVLIQNSWGTGWANHGFGRLSWTVVQRDVSEADTASGFVNGFANSTQIVLNSSADVWAKNAIGNGGWTQETIGTGVTATAGENGLQMILDAAGDVWAKNNVLGTTGWIKETSGGGNKAIATGNGIQMVLSAAGDVWARSSIGFGGWTQETIGSHVTAISTGNNVQMILDGAGNAWAKNNALGTVWTKETSSGDIRSIATDNGLQMVVNTAGDVWARTSIGFGGWTQETIGSNVVGIATGNGVQMILDGNREVWAKTGLIGTTGWTRETIGGGYKSIDTDNGVQTVMDSAGQVWAKGTYANLGTNNWTVETPGGHKTIVTG